MASYTPNYNLKKPADSDSYDIADHNGNMDKIDTALNTINSKLALTNITNVNAIRYNDDRVQIKYFNGQTDQKVLTFNPYDKSIAFSHSDNGTSFITDWEIKTFKEKNDNKSLLSQSYYRLGPGSNCQYSRVGDIAIINMVIICDTPYITNPGIKILSGLPIQYNANNMFYSFPSTDSSSQSNLRLVVSNGDIYARYGTAGKIYDINIVYTCA